MSYSDKEIIIISVCLFTLSVAIVMYIALCVYHVYRRRCCCKLRDEAHADPVKLYSMKEIVEEDRMDLSKARQLRQDNQRHKKLACKRKDAENISPPGKMRFFELSEAETTNTPVKRSFSVFQNSENTNPPGKLSFTDLSVVENTNSPAKRNLSVVQREQCSVTFSYKGSFDIEEYRNYAKEEKKMSVDLIKPLQDQAIVWVPPPPPDPHNPT